MIDTVAQFRDIIFVSIYVSFFLGTIVVLAFADRRVARRVWLVGFFATLVVVTAVGMSLLPVVEMHKFSQPSSEEMTYYELRIVDANGTEIEYDDRAAPPMTGTRTSTIGGEIANDYTDDERLEMGEFYLSKATAYRHDLESGERSATERLQPPRYVDDEGWTAEELEAYEEFEALRVYERTVTYTDDNTAVESNDEQLRVTIDVADETVTEPENT